MAALSIYLLHHVTKHEINSHKQRTEHVLIQCISFTMPDCYNISQANKKSPHSPRVLHIWSRFHGNLTQFQEYNSTNNLFSQTGCPLLDIMQGWTDAKADLSVPQSAGEKWPGFSKSKLRLLDRSGSGPVADARLPFHLTYQDSNTLEL